MSVYTWSQTAADNDDADGTINCREGQAPSTINDSMRAIMAAIAKWRDDLSGNLTTAGTSTAYTVTTNQTFTALTDGLMFSARLHTTSGASPTLNVDSLGAKSIADVYGSDVDTGALISGAVHSFVYDSTDDKWIVFGNVQILPLTRGGTGAATASAARTNLGLVIGTDVQAYDAGLASIAGLTTAADRMIYTTASDTYAVATLTSFARTLLDDSSASAARSTLGVAIGSDVQAYDADLDAIAALAKTDGNIIVGNGSTWVAESGSTARTSLGLGSLATASTINGSNWSGTDLALADGGTGASLSDPNDDRIMFWDDSAGAMTWLDIGNALSISGTTLAATAASDSADGTIEIAVQSEMEAASSTTLAVTPGRTQYHPGVAKFWNYTTYSGGTPTSAASHNVTSISDTDTGELTVTIATDFSSANWAPIAISHITSNARNTQIYSIATGSVRISVKNVVPAAADPDAISSAGFGDQA